MAVHMNEKKLIGNILSEENDSDEESHQKFIRTKRQVLLNREELEGLERSTSAPAGFLAFSDGFLHSQEAFGGSRMDISAPEFVPTSPTAQEPHLKGQILSMALDQQGSRYLQKQVESGSSEEQELIFEEVFKSIYALITDVFGNYIVQKVIEFGTSAQRRSCIQKLYGRTLEFSFHTYGCRVVQKAFECGDHEDRVEMVHEFQGAVEKSIEDQNGNHVIQKCIETLPYRYVDFIVDTLKQNTLKWTVHAYGCRVIQRVIECCPAEVIQPIVQTIVRNSNNISRDAYGNYVIQYMIEKGNAEDRNQIIGSLIGNLCELSKHKFSSNVIEKCLIVGSPEQVCAYAHEVFGSNRFVELCTDKFANFVVQKTIEVAKGELQISLVKRVREETALLKNYPQGRYVLNFIERYKFR